MSSDSGDTVPYAPVLPGAVDEPPRTQPPSARPSGPQPPRTRFLDPFALATNHPVRRPTPVVQAPPATYAQAPPALAAAIPPIPPDHPHLRPPRRVRGAAANLPAGWKRRGWYSYPVDIPTLPELLEFRREKRAEQQRTKELEAQIRASQALRDAEL